MTSADQRLTSTARRLQIDASQLLREQPDAELERLIEAARASPGSGQALTELIAQRLGDSDAIRLGGRYIVEGIIGRGGSGCVLRSRHPLLRIPVALKMLSHALAFSRDGSESFVREASILVQLEHPGIVRVLDAFEDVGTYFIVMPWLEGTTLRDLIDRTPAFTHEQVLRVADEGLAALTALHRSGLVHRDVKPSNLFVTAAGRLVLIDLGIACEVGGSATERSLVGSPPYCSPEQILGRPLDGRSDVYSLGCTLYELVYGRAPFDGDGIDASVHAHLHDSPRFESQKLVEMSDPFIRWLRRLLSRTRAQRPDAATARSELRRMLPAQFKEVAGWHDRPGAAFPVLRETVEWRSV